MLRTSVIDCNYSRANKSVALIEQQGLFAIVQLQTHLMTVVAVVDLLDVDNRNVVVNTCYCRLWRQSTTEDDTRQERQQTDNITNFFYPAHNRLASELQCISRKLLYKPQSSDLGSFHSVNIMTTSANKIKKTRTCNGAGFRPIYLVLDFSTGFGASLLG